jgi:hypothetical protein
VTVCGIYVVLSVVASYLFGSQIQKSVLASVDAQEGLTSSLVIRVSFLIGLLCHIPFIFFASKESWLVILEETKNESLSKRLKEALKP